MGTTLENGVYLPSEGERNCYAGLKTNWEILDQKVADVTALQQAVAGALHRQIVASLPTTDIDPNTIYMILSGTSATENVYNEFMYVNNAWELIGTSATDLTNYYTKAEVDGKLLLKANASDLTSHTGDTTIHVTASDKTKWTNSAKAVVFRYSSTALTPSSTNSNTLLDNTDNLKVGDKVIDSSGVLFSITAIDTQNSTFTIGTALIDLAQDSDVVHKSGNETKSGELTLLDKLNSSDIIPKANLTYNLGNSDYKFLNIYSYMLNAIGRYLGNEASTNQRTDITLYANRDTQEQSCAYITRFRQNRSQGALQTGDLQKIGFDVLENSVRTNNIFDIQCTNWLNDVPQMVYLVSSVSSYSYGKSSNKALFNDLNPSSLGMPDLDNGIDISSYLSVGSSTNDSYTASANGYIGVIFASSTACGCYVYNYTDGVFMRSNSITDSTYTNVCGCFIPILKNQTLNISTRTTESIVSAKFFPCLGNV